MVSSQKVIDFTEQLFYNCENAKTDNQLYKLVIAEFNIKLVLLDPERKFSLSPLLHNLMVCNPEDITDYTVYVVDKEFYEFVLPGKCWSAEDILPDTSISGFIDHQIYTSMEGGSGIFFLVNHSTKKAVKVFNLENNSDRDWEYCYPLRKIFNQFTLNTNYTLIHSGGLGLRHNSNGVMLTGMAGSGKSTICAILTNKEIGYAGDDFLLVNVNTCVAYSLYTTLKVRPHLSEKFINKTIFEQYNSPVINSKTNYYIPPSNHAYLKKIFTIKALIKPTFQINGECEISALPKAEMMKHMALSTIIIVRAGVSSDQITFSKISLLIKQIACFEFSYNQHIELVKIKMFDFLTSKVY